MGGVVGFVIGAIFIKTRDYIPCHSTFLKAVFLAVALWMPTALLELVSGDFLIHLDEASINLLGNLIAAAVFSILLQRWSPRVTT